MLNTQSELNRMGYTAYGDYREILICTKNTLYEKRYENPILKFTDKDLPSGEADEAYHFIINKLKEKLNGN